MKFKHLGISALALGLVVGGGSAISAFASANSEEYPNEAKAIPILKSNADELPEGTIYKDEIKGDTNSGAEYYEFNGTDELPEGTIYKDVVKGKPISGAEYYEFNGTDELPEGTVYKEEVKGNQE